MAKTLNSTRSMIFPNVRHKLGFFTDLGDSCESTRFTSSSIPLSLSKVCYKWKLGNCYEGKNTRIFQINCNSPVQLNVSPKVIVQLYLC